MAESIPRQRPQIVNYAFSPESCVERLIVWGTGPPDNVRCIVEPTHSPDAPSQRAQIGEYSVIPQVWMQNERVIGNCRSAGDLAAIVHAFRSRVQLASHQSASQRRDIFHLAVVPEKVMRCGDAGIRIYH